MVINGNKLGTFNCVMIQVSWPNLVDWPWHISLTHGLLERCASPPRGD